MKIRLKLILIILSVTFLSFLISIAYGYFEMREATINNIKDNLNIVANLQQARVRNIIDMNFERINSFTNPTGVIDAMGKIDQDANQTNKEDLLTRLEDAKRSSSDYQNLWITNASGKVAVSTNKADDGADFSQNPYYISGKAKNSVTFFHDHQNEKNYFYLSGPIKQGNNLLGVYIVQTIADEVINVINDYFGLGNTGETLIAKQDSAGNVEYLLETRFPISEDLKISKQDTGLPIIQALLKNENMFENLADYRGQKVFAATRYIDNIGWGMVVKIDQKEIFDPLNKNLLILGIVTFAYLIISYIIAVLVAHSISKPVETLQQGMDKITKGDLDFKVGTTAKDEIGQLSRGVDKLTGAVKKSRAEIDRKVKEQTDTIVDNQKQMDDQQKAILNVLEDVEEEKVKVTTEKNKIDAILSSIGDAVFVIGLDEKIIMFNKIAEKISGFTQKEVTGKKYQEILKFIYEKDGKINNKFIKDAIKTGAIAYMANHTVLINRFGNKIPVSDSAAPLKSKDGKILGCVVVFHDVTKERELMKMKDEFLNIAAHDLRTPMTAIKGYTDMMLHGDFGKLPSYLREPLNETIGASERLIRLVNDFLTSSRLERGKITVSPKKVDIIPIVKTLANQIAPIAQKKNLKFISPKLINKIIVYTDPDKIQQVIVNLLDNAIKYTKKGSVKFAINTQGKFAIFSVTDTGAGINEENQERLFSKYYQVTGGTSKVIEGQGTGLGLGLYISRLIVEDCGGKIWVESRVGKGSKFSFSLPLVD